MSTVEERTEAAKDCAHTIAEWFPWFSPEECRQIASLAIAAYDRAVQQFDGQVASAGAPREARAKGVPSGRHLPPSEPRLAQGSPDDTEHNDGSGCAP